MIFFLFGLILINSILCFTQIPGDFDNKTVLEGYINPENNLLIFNRKNNELYKYEMESDSIFYTNYTKLKLEPFPTNDSETITDFHFSFIHINSTTISITIFNEKYLSSYVYNASSHYFFISMEEIGPNKLAIFYNSKNASLYNNTISIASFDYKNEKFNHSKKYSIDINKGSLGRANCNCVETSNKNIVCGLIEYYSNILNNYCEYNLFILQEESEINYTKINTNIDKADYTINGIYKNNFIKFISLENERIIFCYYYYYFFIIFGEGIACGLAQVKNNSELIIVIKSKEIFNKMAEPNYLRKYLFSGIKFNNNEVILSYVEFDIYDSRYLAKLTILKNNTFSTDIRYLSYRNYERSNHHNYIQLLKNKDNDLIFIILYKNIAEFDELGYAYCRSKVTSEYNGEKSRLWFDIYPGYYKGHDNDIVFINDKEYNSLFYKNEKEHIKNGIIYNIKNISFYLNLSDYDDIKTNKTYNISFRNTLSPKESEVCTLTLTFYECEEGCDLCTSSYCYDKYRNIINKTETDNRSINYGKPTSILIFITIFSIFSFLILIILVFIRGLKNNQNPNINIANNNIQNQNALLNNYN